MPDALTPDPLDGLRSPAQRVDPGAEFTRRLRARLQRALDLPRGVTVAEVTTSRATTSDRPDRPAGAATAADGRLVAPVELTPYLTVADARAALGYYIEVLSARLEADPIRMPDGRIGHAELVLPGGARLMLSDAAPAAGVVAPTAGVGVSVTLHLTVNDVDDVVDHSVASGATLERPVADYDYGRNGVVRDPFGHRWMISGPTSEISSPGG
jgi:uncharacterized glyoxalase superfamily protein PhnB